MNGRGKKLAKNTISSLCFQITTIICGFILPRLILQQFGSEVNGLVNSIVQFLQIIAFLELGVGAVVQSSLYKPLANKDNSLTSKIIVSAGKFFKRIAQILLIYVIVLIIIYPIIANQDFSYIYTGTLILAMSISSFSQYYFGVVDRLLLTADQKGYIQYNAQTVTVIANTIFCAILMQLDASIQVVKLTTSLIYLIRPLYLRIYVNRNYNIDRKITYEQEPIKQKWNGVAQHVAAVVLDCTDNIVLTVFATLSDVSVYSVYHLVVFGVKQVFISMTNGIQALIGELWAKQETEELKKTFAYVEWSIHTGVTFVFGCTGLLIVSFVQVYTKGVTDTCYVQPIFAGLITIANAMHCLRLPYNIMILAAGHYKQTQKNYIIAALLNILVSITTVKLWGLVGVAIGTLVAMLYQTIWMAYYDSKNFIKWPLMNVAKQLLVDIITVIVAIMATCWIKMNDISYFAWVINAIEVVVVVMITVIAINCIFYKKMVVRLMKSIGKIYIRIKGEKQ